MRIESIHINGFASFNDFKLKFLPGENVIVGTNGTGKSNLLEIIDTALSSEFDDLDSYANSTIDRDKKYIIIELNLENFADKFNDLFHFIMLKIIAHDNLKIIKMDNIFDKLKLLKPFSENILLNFSYSYHQLTKQIIFKKCANYKCISLYNLNRYRHNEGCYINLIHKYIEYLIYNASNFVNQININTTKIFLQEIKKIESEIFKLDCCIPQNFTKLETDDDIIKELQKYYNITINNDKSIVRNTIDYISIICKEYEKKNDLINFFKENYECDVLTFDDLVKIMLYQIAYVNEISGRNITPDDIFQNIVNNFIENNKSYMPINNINYNYLLLKKYENEMSKARSAKENHKVAEKLMKL